MIILFGDNLIFSIMMVFTQDKHQKPNLLITSLTWLVTITS